MHLRHPRGVKCQARRAREPEVETPGQDSFKSKEGEYGRATGRGNSREGGGRRSHLEYVVADCRLREGLHAVARHLAAAARGLSAPQAQESSSRLLFSAKFDYPVAERSATG